MTKSLIKPLEEILKQIEDILERRKEKIIEERRQLFKDLKDELDRLKQIIKYQEDRDGRIGTHSPECYKFGPRHYDCAIQEIERLHQINIDIKGR